MELANYCFNEISMYAGITLMDFDLSFRSAYAFVWYLIFGVILVINDKLEKGVKAQMDECAQNLLDKLTRHMENMTYVLAAGLIIFLVELPKAENPGTMGLAAAQILAWGIFGIHLYRGIAFWIRDRMGLIC